MLFSTLPRRPWEKLGADLFQFKNNHYLLVVDYFSRFPEVAKLSSLSPQSVISALKSMFARFGIPDTFHSDNGPQFSAEALDEFAKSYNFHLTTSSPYYPQGNGLVERMVKTIKSLLEKTGDIYLSLLTYQTTPLPWCGLSPASLLMGRELRSTVPQIDRKLTPDWSYLEPFRQKDLEFRQKQKEYYDQRHRVQVQEELSKGTTVWVKTRNNRVQGSVYGMTKSPRSYLIDIPTGRIRRNQRHLTVVPDPIYTPILPLLLPLYPLLLLLV